MTGAGMKKILIVEDEPDIVRGLSDALEFEGLDVTSTGSGAEGVKLMKERGADCVILDLMLPDLNGYQVCEDFLTVMERAVTRYKIELPDRQLACAPADSPECEQYLGARQLAVG